MADGVGDAELAPQRLAGLVLDGSDCDVVEWVARALAAAETGEPEGWRAFRRQSVFALLVLEARGYRVLGERGPVWQLNGGGPCGSVPQGGG